MLLCSGMPYYRSVFAENKLTAFWQKGCYIMIKEEIKKIWRPGIIAVLILTGAVFYAMFLNFYVQYFPNGPQMDGLMRTAEQWAEEYGTSLSPDEAAKAKAAYPKLIAEADRYTASNSLFKEHGVNSYDEFKEFYNKAVYSVSGQIGVDEQKLYSDANIMLNYLQSEETKNIDGRIYALDTYTQMYDSWLSALQAAEYEKKELFNANKLLSDGVLWQNMLPNEITDTASRYFSNLLVWIIVSVCLLISPLTVRDKMRKMRQLQWSSRHGRKILNTQFKASVLSAIALTTINILLFGPVFLLKIPSVFFDCHMLSFMQGSLPWFNWTLRGWLAVMVLLSYAAGVSAASAAFFLSRYSQNLVAMLLKLIPLIIISAIIAMKLLVNAFYYSSPLYKISGIPGIEAIVPCSALILGAALCMAACKKEKKKEI